MAERRTWAGGVAIAACTLWFGLVTLPGTLGLPAWVSVAVGAGLFLLGAVLTYPAIQRTLSNQGQSITQKAGDRSTQIVTRGQVNVVVNHNQHPSDGSNVQT